ncbi:hypothetical protein T265_08335 [Opisthorchis viverrini]|uniref:ApaG domain-containing protein n=1 Tax=Opisthorchis viverrini TaxID=6198 RepID=A0A075A8P7_OPIVI|nr:hypothetical protein T265_08335 [Opisthorchis viverrini]KER23869.1 hypothetical protein T265_08335 [Opisthorchis viverrini]
MRNVRLCTLSVVCSVFPQSFLLFSFPCNQVRPGCLLFISLLSLQPVGQLQSPSDSPYEPGQLFLHKHFGYRGVVLQSWPAKLFDRNVLSLRATELKTHEYKKADGSNVNVYQVLTDQRDTDLCVRRDSNVVFSYLNSGMDYVFHDDIIPYVSNDPIPIKNEYLQEFLIWTADRDPPLVPTDNLRRWIETRRQSLEVTTVHREVTEGIRTTTIPFFMGRRLVGVTCAGALFTIMVSVYCPSPIPLFLLHFSIQDKNDKHIRYWRYLIRLENFTSERVQLRERFWKVFSITGSLESVRGKGVVGMQPVLSEESPVFQYHSHVQVPVPWAHMWGSFRFERPNGSTMDAKIPSFPLCDRAYWSNSEEHSME